MDEEEEEEQEEAARLSRPSARNEAESGRTSLHSVLILFARSLSFAHPGPANVPASHHLMRTVSSSRQLLMRCAAVVALVLLFLIQLSRLEANDFSLAASLHTVTWVFLKTVYIRNKENVTDVHRLF